MLQGPGLSLQKHKKAYPPAWPMDMPFVFFIWFSKNAWSGFLALLRMD